MISITWAEARKAHACEGGVRAVCKLKGRAFEDLAGSDSIPIAEIKNLDSVIWALAAVRPKLAGIFFCDCAERALKRNQADGREPDVRSWEAIRVAQVFLRGETSQEQLNTAAEAAWAAASVACSAARSAAWAAAWVDARTSTWAAEVAGEAAVWAAGEAARGTGRTAWTARAAERVWQRARFREILEGSVL